MIDKVKERKKNRLISGPEVIRAVFLLLFLGIILIELFAERKRQRENNIILG